MVAHERRYDEGCAGPGAGSVGGWMHGEGPRIVRVVADPVDGDGWSYSRVEVVEHFDNGRTGVIQLDRCARAAARSTIAPARS